MKHYRYLPQALAAAIAAQVAPLASAVELEEITVTAQKRSERLVEVPIAITSFSAENIRQTGVRQLKEVAEFVPNLHISASPDFDSSISIRGVGASSRNIGFDTRVGVYVDGVYLGQSPALNQELLDLERIEILRGPQGTLFGKNTVAGAINLISRQPSDILEGSVNFEYGNFNSQQVSASLNVPLSENLYSKVSFSSQQRDGLTENTFTGHDINAVDAQAYRAQLLYNASEYFTASLSLDGTDSERLSYTGKPITNTFGTGLATDAMESHTLSMNVDPSEVREIRGASVTLNWDLDSGHVIKSITASRDTDIVYHSDADFSAVDLGELHYADSYQQVTQEFQLISPESETLQYMAGLYFYQQEGDTLRKFFASELGASLVNGDSSRPTISDGTVDTDSYAAFLNGSYAFSDQWKLGFGFRYSEEEKSTDWMVDGSGSGDLGTATATVQDKRSDSHFSPSISLNYAFDSNIHSYVKYSGGFKSGGFNLDFVTQSAIDAGLDFDKETVDSFEIGLKGTALNRSLSFNIAAFQANYTDYQVNQFVDLGEGGTSISIRNAAEVETRGLEAEFTYRPVDQLQINAAFGLLDASFGDYQGGGANGADVSGNQLPNASDYSINLGAQYFYSLPVLDAELSARIDYSFRDDYYNTADNVRERTLLSGNTIQYGWVDDIQLINARIELVSMDGTWDLGLWARNLTDEKYLTETSREFFGTITHLEGNPRTFGIDVGYQF